MTNKQTFFKAGNQFRIFKNRSAAVWLLMSTLLLVFSGCQINADALSSPKYPQKTAFSDLTTRQQELSDKSFIDNLQKFSYISASAVLSQSAEGNGLYSPISLYLSLAMSAAGATGETQKEILAALSMKDIGIQQMILQTAILFRNHYFDNEVGHFTIANSLWINKSFNVKKEFIKSMSENLYLTSSKIDFNSDTAAEKINRWISENTEGISDSVNIPKSRDLVMVLINAVRFSDEWINAFDIQKTKTDSFYLSNGSHVQVDYMNAELVKTFIKEKGYTSSYLQFKNDGKMVFIIPDKGVSLDSMLLDPDLMAKSANVYDIENRQMGEVLFKIPKFDFSMKVDLKNVLAKLGIISAFDDASADFSNISAKKPLYISKMLQSTAVSIDEKGCKASAITKTEYYTSGKPITQIEMILDRPFIFIITGGDNIPLFIGKVENPLLE